MQRRGGTVASESRVEREEELALFHDVRRGERERKSNAVHPLPPHDADLVGSRFSSLQCQRAPSEKRNTPTLTSRKLVHEPATADLTKNDDDLLTIELGKNDYDWLLTPPGTPLINSLDHNTASNSDDFLSRAASFSSVRTLAAIKTARFSSTETEGVAREEGSSKSSSRPASPTKRPISFAHVSHPTTPTTRTKPSLAPGSHHPTTPTNRTKLSSASGCHPTTPTSRPTTALSFKNGSSSLPSSSTRKTVTSSPVTPPLRRFSGSQTQSHSLSAGVSRSSSISKARPLLSRSLPTSRGSSPTANQATLTSEFCLELESPRRSFSKHLTKAKTARITPRSIISKGSTVGSLPTLEGTTSIAQTPMSSLNQSETSRDTSRKTCSSGIATAKSALHGTYRMERQSSNSFIMSSNIAVQTGKSQDTIPRSSTKDAGKLAFSSRIIGTSHSPETTWSALQAKNVLVKSSLTSSRDHGGSSKYAPRQSLGYALHHQNLHQGTSNNGVASSPFWSLLGSRHAGTQTCPRNFDDLSNSNARADDMTIASFEEDNNRVDDFQRGSSFLVSPPRQSDHLASLIKDAHMNNWLGSHQYADEGLDLLHVFEQGVNKFESCESPLVCPHGGGAVNCDLCNVKMRLQMLNEKSKASFGANAQILGEA